MNARIRFLTLALGSVAAVGVAWAASPPKITRVGDVSLSITSMTIPGMGTRDMVMGGGQFYRGSGQAGSGAVRDQCFVTVNADEDMGALGNLPGQYTPPKDPVSLDAGNPLTLRQGSATYTTMPRRQSGKVISYAMPAANPMNSTVKAPTAGLVIDIPGAANGFPAMKNRAFPVATLVRLTAPKAGENLTPATRFGWSNPTGDAATQVMLMMRQEEKNLNVVCVAADDGQFAFPAATQSDLKARGFSQGQLVMVGRISHRQYQEGDAQLNLTVMTMQPVLDMGEE